MLYLTGFADEGASDIQGQIKATQELGWKFIESRGVFGKNIHDITDAQFDEVCAALAGSGVSINCFGSAIANWGKQVTEPFDSSLEESRRAIPRMRRLGVKLVRIMSFAVRKDRGPEDQMEEERFRRVRELVRMFADEGMQAVHENCMNYGGMGWTYTLRLLENAPGLRLVFDTGNPVFTDDRSKPEPYPKQSSWEFYEKVRDFVDYVHIKDGVWSPDANGIKYSWAGEGNGDVRKIVTDLLKRGYSGGISMEPHLKVVHHDPKSEAYADARYENYVEYGRRFEKLLAECRAALPKKG